MAEITYQLRIQKGPEPGTVYPLTSVSITLGRDPLADITINDPEVSRQHARLTHISTSYELLDLGSTNGTFVDGQRLAGESVTLRDGQIVEMGSGVSMLFQSVGNEPDVLPTMLDTASGFGEEAAEPSPIDAFEEPIVFAAPADEVVTAVPEPDAPLTDDPHTMMDFPEPNWPESPPMFDDQPVEDATPVNEWEPPAEEMPAEPEIPSAAAIIESFKDEPDHEEASSEPPPTQQIIDQPPEKKSNNQRIIAIVIGLFLLLCCCCFGLTIALWYGGDIILQELQLMP